jgi:hypothetical protein
MVNQLILGLTSPPRFFFLPRVQFSTSCHFCCEEATARTFSKSRFLCWMMRRLFEAFIFHPTVDLKYKRSEICSFRYKVTSITSLAYHFEMKTSPSPYFQVCITKIMPSDFFFFFSFGFWTTRLFESCWSSNELRGLNWMIVVKFSLE